MDDLQNYIDMSGSVSNTNEMMKQKFKDVAQEAKNKILEITKPVGEGFMVESGRPLVKKAGSILVNSLKEKGVDTDAIKGIVGAYKKGGVKGVVRHLVKSRLRPQEENLPSEEEGMNIKDLSKDEFGKVKGTINSALKDRFKSFPEDQQRSISRKYRNEKLEENDEPDLETRQQGNAQKISDIMDDMEQRNKIFEDNPMKDLVKQPLGEDDVLNEGQRNITGTIKNQVEGLNKSLIKDEVEQEGQALKKDIVKKAEEKAGQRVAEEDEEGGGPEDIVGDVVAGAIGLGTFLGGVFGARHIKPETPFQNIANISYQEGA